MGFVFPPPSFLNDLSTLLLHVQAAQTPAMAQGMGINGTLSWVFDVLQYFEKILRLVDSLR